MWFSKVLPLAKYERFFFFFFAAPMTQKISQARVQTQATAATQAGAFDNSRSLTCCAIGDRLIVVLICISVLTKDFEPPFLCVYWLYAYFLL